MQLPTACPICGNNVVGLENSEVTNYRKENNQWKRRRFMALHCVNFRTEPPAGSTLLQTLASNLYCSWKTEFVTESERNIPNSEAPIIDLSVKYNPIDRTPKLCVKCHRGFIPEFEFQQYDTVDCRLAHCL